MITMEEIMESLKQYSILYAEDESIIRLKLSKELKKYFVEVYVAKDGKEAIELYEKEKPNVLFLDVNMLFFSGLEVAKHVRQKDETLPIVMLTAYTQTDILLEAIELNLCKYLVKPISKRDLDEVFEKLSIKLKENNKDILHLEENYFWHTKSKKLFNNNTRVELTPREMILLELLINNRRQKVSHEEIMALVWEDKFTEEISIDSVKTLMNSLRKKIPKKSIKSVYGSGYIFN